MGQQIPQVELGAQHVALIEQDYAADNDGTSDRTLFQQIGALVNGRIPCHGFDFYIGMGHCEGKGLLIVCHIGVTQQGFVTDRPLVKGLCIGEDASIETYLNHCVLFYGIAVVRIRGNSGAIHLDGTANDSQGMENILLVYCVLCFCLAKLVTILFCYGNGQGLLAAHLGGNAELVILCAVIQVDFQTIGRHILPVIAVLILYFAVLTAKVDFTLAGIILRVNSYSKVVAFLFIEGHIVKAINGHSTVLIVTHRKADLVSVRCTGQAIFLHASSQRVGAGLVGDQLKLVALAHKRNIQFAAGHFLPSTIVLLLI